MIAVLGEHSVICLESQLHPIGPESPSLVVQLSEHKRKSFSEASSAHVQWRIGSRAGFEASDCTPASPLIASVRDTDRQRQRDTLKTGNFAAPQRNVEAGHNQKLRILSG